MQVYFSLVSVQGVCSKSAEGPSSCSHWLALTAGAPAQRNRKKKKGHPRRDLWFMWQAGKLMSISSVLEWKVTAELYLFAVFWKAANHCQAVIITSWSCNAPVLVSWCTASPLGPGRVWQANPCIGPLWRPRAGHDLHVITVVATTPRPPASSERA